MGPPPELEVGDCRPFVCLTVESAIELGLWAARVQEAEGDLAGCPYVERVPYREAVE